MLKMNLKNTFAVLMTFAALSASTHAMAQPEERLLSEEEMMRMFKQQSEKFREKRETGEVDTMPSSQETAEQAPAIESPEIKDVKLDEMQEGDVALDVSIVPEHAKTVDYNRPMAGYVPLGDIQLAVDMNNKSLREIIDEIVMQASQHTGDWQVKWRLRKEHDFLLDEKVNLTAESSFREFVDHLVDRVANMTGIRLFVTIFDTSRVIIISDTYY